MIKIVPDLNARQEGSSEVVGNNPQRSERIVTAVIPTTYVNAAELVPVLRPLLPQEAHLAATARSDALVVADSSANVSRIMRIVRELDRDNAQAIEVVALKFAEAVPLVTTMQQLLAASANGTPGIQPPIAADERSNSILIGGPPAEKIRLRTLIRDLDKPSTKTAEGIEVIYLRYASAKDLVPVLQAVGDRAKAPPSGKRSGQGGTPAVLQGGGQGEVFQVQADESTNAVIVQAPPELMAQIKGVIAKLDIRRAQVLVEGVVAEVSNNKADELGVQWASSVPRGTGEFAGSLFPGVASGPLPDPFVKTATPSLLAGLTLGYFTGGDLRTLLRALSGDQYTNVLSTPTLMTLDNAKAEIVVGQNVPFVTGSFTSAATAGSPFQTIERKDVGILLKVKPQINEGETVTMEIEQEVSSVDRATTGPNLVTNKRSIKTSVLVDDKQIVVLGGLISDELHENKSKIPLIGDLPILGHLFKNTNSDFTKTNLMVFLRPTIVRDKATNQALTGSRYKDIRQKQKTADIEEQFFLRDKGPELPADGLAE